LAGLLLHDPAKDNQLELDDIAQRLSAENIELELELTMERLFSSELGVSDDNIEEFFAIAAKALERALRAGKRQDLDHIVLSLRRGLKRASLGTSPIEIEKRQRFYLSRRAEELFVRLLHPRYLLDLAERNPEAALSWVQLAREMGGKRWLERYGEEIFEQAFTEASVKRLLLHKPAIFIEALRLVQIFGWLRAADALLQSLASFLDRPGGDKTLLKQLPLEALPELQWLAQTTADRKLYSALQLILSDGGAH